jgi:hypothetical protein
MEFQRTAIKERRNRQKEHVAEMKRKTDSGMRQSALRLPADLHQRLTRAGGEAGMGAEIRRRLEASFAAEKAPANPKTQELLGAIAFIADKTDFYYENWAEDPFAFEVLRAGIDLLLTASRPKGEAVQKPNPNPDPDASGFTHLFFDSASSPKDIARFILGDLMHARSKRADEAKRR